MSTSIKSRLPFYILLLALVVLVAYLNWPQESVQKKRHQRVVAVKVATVKQDEFKDVIEALGNVRANEQVLITSQYADVVEEVTFTDGQIVKKGDTLVKFNDQEEYARVKELEANLAESVAQLNRYQGLLSKKATSKSQVDEQEAKTKAITAQLLSAKSKLSALTIHAPFDGVLGFREISVGSYVKSGDVITSLDDLSIVKVDFSVPERFFTTIKVGQTVNAANTAYGDESFVGRISSVDPRIDNITRMVKVRAEVPNNEFKLRPGMLLTIEVERKIDNVMQIPESSIIPIEDKHYVFVIADNVAQRKEIQVGRRKPGIAEVLGGLHVDDFVVTEGALKLREGSQVNVLEK